MSRRILKRHVIVHMIIVSLLYSGCFSSSAYAAGSRFISNRWIDEEKGPGVARWVEDEDSSEQADESAVDAVEETTEEIEPESATVQNQDSTDAQTGQADPNSRVIDPSKPMIALTFDDGPYGPVDHQIMDCLAQYGSKATFFVVGSRCQMYPAAMQRMAAEGHEIGNHTYDHKNLTRLGTAQIRYQIDKSREAIVATAGVGPTTVRLPGGNKNATVLAAVKEPILMWSLDTLDWKTRNTDATVSTVLAQVKDGDVVLMHDLYQQTGAAATQIIPALVQQGYQLVTVSELAQYRGGLAAGGVYSRFRP